VPGRTGEKSGSTRGSLSIVRTYLAVTGILFGLFAVMHFFIAWQHARAPVGSEWWGWPALIGVISAALTAWAFRLLRRAPAAP